MPRLYRRQYKTGTAAGYEASWGNEKPFIKKKALKNWNKWIFLNYEKKHLFFPVFFSHDAHRGRYGQNDGSKRSSFSRSVECRRNRVKSSYGAICSLGGAKSWTVYLTTYTLLLHILSPP